MVAPRHLSFCLRMAALVLLALLGACAHMPVMSERECMARAMYFESNRSSEDGMLAVGTVVMNRVNSPKFPNDVCSVVGQPNQFAPGVMTRRMEAGKDLAFRMAAEVLRGKRHPGVRKAAFFHTAGYSYPYTNMHYVLVAGGNAFYEKRKDATASQASVTPGTREYAAAHRPARESIFDGWSDAAVPVAVVPASVAPQSRVLARPPEPQLQPVLVAAPQPVTVYRSVTPAPATARVARLAPPSGTPAARLAPLSIEEVIARSGGY